MQQTLAEIGQEFDTDKAQSPGYLENYERHFGHLRETPVRLLELGVLHGGSLLMWQRYFSKGLIVGLDIVPNPFEKVPDRIRFYQGEQSDEALLDLIAHECAPDGFDIVIDDAGHVGTVARASFRHLFEKHLKSNGTYVIEDWGTGYWDSWPDGSIYRMAQEDGTTQPSESMSLRDRLAMWLGRRHLPSGPPVDPKFAAHNFGMVGFVKELIDEVGWKDLTDPELGNTNLPRRESMIREIAVTHGQAIVIKA